LRDSPGGFIGLMGALSVERGTSPIPSLSSIATTLGGEEGAVPS
jgi:hypothetical protein